MLHATEWLHFSPHLRYYAFWTRTAKNVQSRRCTALSSRFKSRSQTVNECLGGNLRLGAKFGEVHMAWYAYCITEQQTLNNGVRARRPFLMDGIQGVNSASVLSYPSGEFAVIVSEYERTEDRLEEKHVLEHARVV